MIQTNSQDFDSQNHNDRTKCKVEKGRNFITSNSLWPEPNIQFSFPKNPYEWYKDLNPQIFWEQT